MHCTGVQPQGTACMSHPQGHTQEGRQGRDLQVRAHPLAALSVSSPLLLSPPLSSLQKIKDYEPDENTILVFAKCDDFMEALCKRLDVKIPPFVLHRRAKVAVQQGEEGTISVSVTGLDIDEDLPYSFIKVLCCLMKTPC